jgi:hypothetical protein
MFPLCLFMRLSVSPTNCGDSGRGIRYEYFSLQKRADGAIRQFARDAAPAAPAERRAAWLACLRKGKRYRAR